MPGDGNGESKYRVALEIKVFLTTAWAARLHFVLEIEMIQLTSDQQKAIRDGLCARVRDLQLNQDFVILSKETFDSLRADVQTAFRKLQAIIAERVPDPSAFIGDKMPELMDLATRTAFM